MNDNPPINWSWGPTVAVDFEAYYDKDVTLTELGNWHYCRHPKTAPYLVSIYDGTNLWVGNPDKFDWTSIDSRNLLSHNASFDEEAYLAGVERGAYHKINYTWYCTADLSTWGTGHRNLKDAVKALFGVEISKQVRTDAKGKSRKDFEADGSWEAMLKYAGDDAEWCWKIWEKLGPKWPEREVKISRLNRERGRYGVRIDVPELRRSISLARRVVAEAEAKLPWVERGLKPASTKGVAEECRKDGIPSPPVKTGLNGDPEAAEEWLEKYGDKLPWVKALKDLRKGKKILAMLEKMESRIRDDETLPFSLLYWGAHTGRFAGTGGINFQNFNKEVLFLEHDPEGKGIDVRGLLIPRKGKRFAIVDLSQIEPRCCLPGTLVKTDSGYKCIEDLTLIDKVWDGTHYVSHGGLLRKPNPGSVVALQGTRLTSDHKVYVSRNHSIPAGQLSRKDVEAANQTRRPDWADVWQMARAVGSESVRALYAALLVPVRVWKRARRPAG
jgi:hypothetical protein